MTIRRRDLLTGTALALLGHQTRGATISGGLPWKPNAGSPPPVESDTGWRFFTADEAALVEAIADRIIPPDPKTPGGKEAGCAVFMDRQLAGAYGSAGEQYQQGPFLKGDKSQGPQSSSTPAQSYRSALKALDAHCRAGGGKAFVDLSSDQQDGILRSIEDGSLALGEVDAKEFFTTLLKDMQEGFFSDPVYGGNKDMCGWTMIGYPGAHYDYRDWVTRHNEPYPHPPVSITGRPDWTPKT